MIEATRTDRNSQNIAGRVGEGERRAEELAAQDLALSGVTPQKHHTPTRGSSADCCTDPCVDARNRVKGLTEGNEEPTHIASTSTICATGRKPVPAGGKEDGREDCNAMIMMTTHMTQILIAISSAARKDEE